MRRPEVDAREVVDEATLDTEVGLVGDNWHVKPSLKTGAPNPEAQLTVMNARVTALVAGEDRERWAQAGDQLYVDLDLSYRNLPPGTRLRVGEAVIEVTAEPHRGCGKFSARFGVEALKFVNSAVGPRAEHARHQHEDRHRRRGPHRRPGREGLALAARRRSFFAAAAETFSRTVAERLPTASTAMASAR